MNDLEHRILGIGLIVGVVIGVIVCFLIPQQQTPTYVYLGNSETCWYGCVAMWKGIDDAGLLTPEELIKSKEVAKSCMYFCSGYKSTIENNTISNVSWQGK